MLEEIINGFIDQYTGVENAEQVDLALHRRVQAFESDIRTLQSDGRNYGTDREKIMRRFKGGLRKAAIPTLEKYLKLRHELDNSSPDLKCDNGWKFFQTSKSCYFVGHNKNFEDAEADCVSKGGHLASIHSQEENDFLCKLVKTGNAQYSEGMSWIGLQKVNEIAQEFHQLEGGSQNLFRDNADIMRRVFWISQNIMSSPEQKIETIKELVVPIIRKSNSAQTEGLTNDEIWQPYNEMFLKLFDINEKWSYRLLKDDVPKEVRALEHEIRKLKVKPDMFNNDKNYVLSALKMAINKSSESSIRQLIKLRQEIFGNYGK
ncbi:hypothetical protein WR25_24763 [Diploscapter pachys]|uniref:C-type lectin domain-containing protein n=1 Tax=Diploscapter pachys TaxID=2018661 RepID=A0A2A2KWJ0_9BILA|nr:hypothetical protein WR25_24763 [Diploscapter pachys]